MLDFLKGAANLLAGPMSAVVDVAGNALGLPPLITNGIKTAAGVATGNVMMAASGVLGVADDLKKNPPGKTEYQASSGTSAKATDGYAAASASKSPLDPKLLDFEDALKVLEANFSQLDLLDGKKSGALSKNDLARAAHDDSLSPKLRDAARFLTDNPAFFERVDGRGVFSAVMPTLGRLYNDDSIRVGDLRTELTKVAEEFAKYGRPQRPGGASPGPAGPCPPPTSGTGTPPPAAECPPRSSGGGGASGGVPPDRGGGPRPGTDCGPSTGGGSTPPTTGSNPSTLDPDFREYREALAILRDNWDTFDSAVGARDNVMTRDNLQAILDSPASSSMLKRAAQFFKDHPEYYDRLEMAAGVGERDGIVGRPDVTAALGQADSTLGTSSSSGGGRASSGVSVKGIVDNPNMSIEDKIQAILMNITTETDDEIMDVMQSMADARDQKATLGTSEADKKKGAKLESSMQELELRLQRLVEKRKAMFDLMSNMSSKFNEMAKTAISNLRSA
ncbi:hypothetical protein LZ198_19620 [Myxococcus sp. K15C18031901]|uniref:hypothetical protein n=1 Tax=Myxococcus dinghuensis TaxID=2906761 RepID=UPI0020A7AFD4|nr:hypothetical protein [Myxococcus dinghuensis]MCP3101087.1 hypothetical protein [Myxococcus dinghuensis]